MAVSFYKNMSRANAEAGLDVSGGQVPLGGLMFTLTGEIYLQTGTSYGNPNSTVAAERKSSSVVAYGSVSDVANLQTAVAAAQSSIASLTTRVGAVELSLGNASARSDYEDVFGTQSIYAALVFLYESQESSAISVDAALSSTSANPVQNKVVKAALDGKAASSHQHAMSDVQGLTAELALKQTVIQDLDDIRENAEAALTAVQPEDISDMATQTWVSEQQYATVAEFDPEDGTGVVETEELDVYHDMGSVRTKSELPTNPSNVVLRGIMKDEETGDKYVAFPNAVVVEYTSSAIGRRNQFIFLKDDAVSLQEFKSEVDTGHSSMFEGKGYPKFGALYAPYLGFYSGNDVMLVPVAKDSTHICIALVENASNGKVYFLEKAATDTVKIQTSELEVYQHCIRRATGEGIPDTATSLPSDEIYWDLFSRVTPQIDAYTKDETDAAFLKKADAENTYATKTQLTDGSVTKIGTTDVGGGSDSGFTPIFLNNGVPTAASYRIGTNKKPVYMVEGVLEPINYTLGDACAKGVDSTVGATGNLPTSSAVKTYVDALQTLLMNKLAALDNSVDARIVNGIHELGSIYHPRGTVQSESDLEALSSSASVGDVYNVADTGMNYVYIGQKFSFTSAQIGHTWSNAEVGGKSSFAISVYLGAGATTPTNAYLKCLADGHLVVVDSSGNELTYRSDRSDNERFSELYKEGTTYRVFKMNDSRSGSLVMGSGEYFWDSFGATINLEWH